MKSATYFCVNCQINFEQEADYIGHYKSEHHRYNIKRKLIGLPPLTFQEYHLQFDEEKTSKQSVDQDFYCEICSKKFMNSGTYKQHLSSKRHRLNRAQLTSPENMMMSKSSSSSNFSIIGAEKAETCIFCTAEGTRNHMRHQHCFPPFEAQCIDYQGLVSYLRSKIASFQCVYCQMKFTSQQSTKQHMKDMNHSKINIESFNPYEKFYLWKILESSSEQDQQLKMEEESMEQKKKITEIFEKLDHPTMDELQQKRMQKIQFTATGAIINGKQVGYRHLKRYYKQYLNRQIKNLRQKYQPALQADKSSWKLAIGHYKVAEHPSKINQVGNHR